MKKEIENNIDKTLESIHTISRAEANPYLFDKIKLRLAKNVEVVSYGIRWSAIITCFLVAGINCGSIYLYLQKTSETKKEIVYEGIGNELGLNQTYNY